MGLGGGGCEWIGGDGEVGEVFGHKGVEAVLGGARAFDVLAVERADAAGPGEEEVAVVVGGEWCVASCSGRVSGWGFGDVCCGAGCRWELTPSRSTGCCAAC
jgi:hypothetical protein